MQSHKWLVISGFSVSDEKYTHDEVESQHLVTGLRHVYM